MVGIPLTKGVAPITICTSGIGPPQKGYDSFSKIASIHCQRILHPWWYFIEGFPFNQALRFKVLKGIRECLRTYAGQSIHQSLEPQSFVIPDGIYDKKCPFLADDVYDAFEWTEAHLFAFLIHTDTFLVDSYYCATDLID